MSISCVLVCSPSCASHIASSRPLILLALPTCRIGYRYLDDSEQSGSAGSSTAQARSSKRRTKAARFPACCVVVHGDDRPLSVVDAGLYGGSDVTLAIAPPPKDGPPPPPPPGSSDEDFDQVQYTIMYTSSLTAACLLVRSCVRAFAARLLA